MLSRIVPALAVLMFTGPALAEGIGGFAAVASGYALAHGEAQHLTAQAVGPIAIAGMPVVLEQTTIGQLVGRFGGTIGLGKDDTGLSYEYVCYGLGDRTLWLRADGESSDAPITTIAAEQGTPQAGWDCIDAPDALDTVSFGIPGLGAPTEEVSARLGSSAQDALGRFGYESAVPSDANAGAVVSQTILYQVSDGTVNAIAVSQKTSG